MDKLPVLGVGVGFREEMKADIFLNRDRIDFLEITSDHYLEGTRRKLDELGLLKENFTLIPHSLDLSLGSAEGLNAGYLDRLAELIERIDPPWFSDHVCFTRSGGRQIGHLAPLPFTDEALGVLVKNITEVTRLISTPLILENITYNIRFSSSEMSEARFLRRVIQETGCGMLLDVTNLYINSVNLGYDWRGYLDELPLDRVVQVHFVGSRRHGTQLVDAHADATDPAVWEVFREVARGCDIKGAVLERDDNFPSFEEILDEVDEAREILARRSVGAKM